MPNKKTRKPKKARKASTPSRRSPRERKVVVEERTRVIPARRVAVRREPVTLSRALGEAAVVEPTAEPPAISETTIVRRRNRV
jgi:hypothetical protein